MEQTKPKKLLLLDAFALMYRAFHAFSKRPLINSKGMNVSAIVGFTNTLYDLIQKEQPTHLAIAFDPKGPTVRVDEHDFYKANREEMPEELRASIPYIEQIIAGMNIPLLLVDGYEADDIIGTIAKKAEQDGFTVYMVTPDKDYGQIVSENIFMYKPAYRGNDFELLGVAEILKKWDISRIEQVIDMLGLMGDSADNIPGIKGIGEKTAAKLLKEFDSIENLLQNTHLLKGKLREKVEAGKQDAMVSKYLATIICDVPLPYEPEKYVLEDYNAEVLAPLFRELEFRTLGKRILGDSYELNEVASPNIAKKEAATDPSQLNMFGKKTSQTQSLFATTETPKGKNIDNTPHTYLLIDTAEKQQDLAEKLQQQTLVCFDTETTSVDANDAELVGLSFCFEKSKAFYVPLSAKKEETMAVLELFKAFFENEKIAKIGQNIKYDLLILKWYDIEIKGTLHDTMLAHYLLEPDMRHNMTVLAENYLQYTPVSIESLIGKKGKNQLSMRQIAVERVAEYAGEDADITFQLHKKIYPTLAPANLNDLYTKIEMPLVPILADMEFEGVALDCDFLGHYSKKLNGKAMTLRESIFKTAGVEFNLDSPKQLGTILFDHLKIAYKGKKTKTGQYSTNEETLRYLAESHTIIAEILNYRELNKLLGTYVDALPRLINPKSGRLHSSFNQAVVATGRLSSANPNLQNIPIRTERGRQIRKAFVARNNDFVLLAADYSQVELRLMAEMSGDINMVEAFQNGLDIHSATAARIYHIGLEEVTSDMRRKAKMVNFGLIYGISAFGLSQRLNIKRSEAKDIIDEYFKQYEGIKNYMEIAVNKAKENNFAATLLGRKRYLRDINSANRTLRQFAERNAINMPIQGTAADLVKIAMIDIFAELKKRNLQSKMVLQVHDELVFDVHKSELEEMQVLVRDKMQNAMKLSVPLKVDVGIGDNWLEAH